MYNEKHPSSQVDNQMKHKVLLKTLKHIQKKASDHKKPLLVNLSQPKRFSNCEYHVYKLRNVSMHYRTHYLIAQIQNGPPVVIVTELEKRV